MNLLTGAMLTLKEGLERNPDSEDFKILSDYSDEISKIVYA